MVVGRRCSPALLFMLEYRRRLPHLHPDRAYIFLTWRLLGLLPAMPEASYPTPGHAFAAVDRVLHRLNSGPQYLRGPRIADLVAETIRSGEICKMLVRSRRVGGDAQPRASADLAPHAGPGNYALVEILDSAASQPVAGARRTALLARRVVRSLGSQSCAERSNSAVYRDESGVGRVGGIGRAVEMVQRGWAVLHKIPRNLFPQRDGRVDPRGPRRGDQRR